MAKKRYSKPPVASDNVAKSKIKIKKKKTLVGYRQLVLLQVGLFAVAAVIFGVWYSYRPHDSDAEEYKLMNKPNATQKIKTKPDHRQSRDQQASHKFTVSVQNYIEMQSVVVNDIQLRVQELKVQHRKSHAKVFIIENFLSQHEMQSLVKAHDHHSTDQRIPPPLFCFDGVNTLQAHLDDAGIKYTASDSDFTAGTYCVNSTFSHRLKHVLKWSVSTAFYTGESKFSWILQDRIFKATGLKPENGGKYQLTSYSEGVGYKTHTDCVLNDEKRDRYGTFLVYLEDVEEGGETRFPQLDIAVKPKAGRALIWNSMDAEGNCDPMTVHSADKVARGRKVILQRWYYYHNFPALGKRMSEPDLPVRLPHQPMVQCDQYDSGSCRWYDEWGYGHLREYRQMNQNNQL